MTASRGSATPGQRLPGGRQGRGWQRIRRALFLLLPVLAVIGIGECCYYLFWRGSKPGPTLIEELRSGSVNAHTISQVDILKFDPGGGWPFTERDYAKLPSISLADRGDIVQLVRVLKSEPHVPSEFRGHPYTPHFGIMRIWTTDQRHFYLFYTVFYHNGSYYTELRAGSAGSTNPNAGRDYENTLLVDYLRDYDPWFQDVTW